MPPNIQGANFTAVNGEFRGDGRSGRKASGMLMVDGVLYLLARNLDNAGLAWSREATGTRESDYDNAVPTSDPRVLRFRRA